MHLTNNLKIKNMNLMNDLKEKNKITTYDVTLTSLILSNMCCFFYIHQQNKQIIELIKINKDLTDSVNKLKVDITKIGEGILTINSKTAPVIINTSENGLLNKPLLFVCVAVASLGVTYYLGTVVSTKVSSLVVPKIISFSSVFCKLPIFEQATEMSVFIGELSTNLLIKTLGDQIESIEFRHINDRDYTPIIKALKYYFESRVEKIDPLGDQMSSIATDVVEQIATNPAPTLLDITTNLSSIF